MANPNPPNPPISSPNPGLAAVYRLVAAFIAFVVGVLLLTFLQMDPTVKAAVIGLVIAAILAIEEYFKSQAGL